MATHNCGEGVNEQITWPPTIVLDKYPSGLTMKAAKYPRDNLYNTSLRVNTYVLELPLFNQQLSNIEAFRDIATSKGVELRFQAEPPAGWKP